MIFVSWAAGFRNNLKVQTGCFYDVLKKIFFTLSKAIQTKFSFLCVLFLHKFRSSYKHESSCVVRQTLVYGFKVRRTIFRPILLPSLIAKFYILTEKFPNKETHISRNFAVHKHKISCLLFMFPCVRIRWRT